MMAPKLRTLVDTAKKNEHNYSLQKSFFERKLHAAEAAISKNYLLSSCLRNLSYILEEISKYLPIIINKPPEFIKSSLESISIQLKKTTEPALDAANAVSLFFDLDESEDSALIEEGMDLISSVNLGNMFLPILIENYSKASTPQERDEAQKTFNGLLTKMQSDVAKLSRKATEGADKISATIKKIRADMKRYES